MLIIEASPGYTIDVFNHSEDSAFAVPEAARRGDHTRQGVFGFHSNSVSVNSTGISVLDISPIIFNYFGIDGKLPKKNQRIKGLKNMTL